MKSMAQKPGLCFAAPWWQLLVLYQAGWIKMVTIQDPHAEPGMGIFES